MSRWTLSLATIAVLAGWSLVLAQETAKVQVTVQVPGQVASFKDQQLEVRLYEYDPRIADKGATLLDKYLMPFTHEAGKDTSKEVKLGEKAAINPKMGYYVTVFVLDAAGKRTHIGEKDGKSGLSKVLTDGNPSKVTSILRSVK